MLRPQDQTLTMINNLLKPIAISISYVIVVLVHYVRRVSQLKFNLMLLNKLVQQIIMLLRRVVTHGYCLSIFRFTIILF